MNSKVVLEVDFYLFWLPIAHKLDESKPFDPLSWLPP